MQGCLERLVVKVGSQSRTLLFLGRLQAFVQNIKHLDLGPQISDKLRILNDGGQLATESVFNK